MSFDLITELGPQCRDPQRREDVRSRHSPLNGIDFVEYEYRPADEFPHVLIVSFLKSLPQDLASGPDGAYGLSQEPDLIWVHGGRRIVGVRALEARRIGERLEVRVDQAGDFSTYYLSLGWILGDEGGWAHVMPGLDARLSVAPIDFKAGCPKDFDCAPGERPAIEPSIEPLLDYLAKDYASFRRLLLDLISQRNPDWMERNPADLGMALVEVLAHNGDVLSYYQDAVANEAYLATARRRASVKRHARLVDYRMHDGRSASTFVHFRVRSHGVVPERLKILTRIGAPLRGSNEAPGVVLSESELRGVTESALADRDLQRVALAKDPALADGRLFETRSSHQVRPEHNRILIHAWGNRECFLPVGATSAYLYALEPADELQVVAPDLACGDYLLLEEVRGRATGERADADTALRQVVRLVEVKPDEDRVYSDRLKPEPGTGEAELGLRSEGEDGLPLLHVRWESSDALRRPFCLSARTREDRDIHHVSVARGNIVPADYGETLEEIHTLRNRVQAGERFRLGLGAAPLTFEAPPGLPATDARPAVRELELEFPTGPEVWKGVPDLLDSPMDASHFAVDVDDDGRATLRFGDGEYGREVAGAGRFSVRYRMGNGRSGNVGAEALAHVVHPLIPPSSWPSIEYVRNPIAAEGGTDPEAIQEVREKAPAAFRAESRRAVTEDDYARAACELDGVSGAVASFRWTGSWYTVFVGVDPSDPKDIVSDTGGRTRLRPDFEAWVRNGLRSRMLAGYDLLVRSGEYVALEIDIDLCVEGDHFQGDVMQAVYRALGGEMYVDGTRGFFHPSCFTFGDDVPVSRLYAAVVGVPGVRSAQVTRFRRAGCLDDGELDAGVIEIGPWEIARLDNDPNFQENGTLRVSARGGK